MKRSYGRWAVVVSAAVGLAAACGGEDGKRKAQGEGAGEAGQGGEAAGPSAGGSESHAGEPAVIEAGAGGSDEPGVGGTAGSSPTGGMAGEPTAAGSGGMPSGGDGGQAGEPSSGGTGGEPPLACCEPRTCADLADADCGFAGIDPCTGQGVHCGCEEGLSCVDGSCETCVPDVYACENNPSLCGETVDNCGNPISCTDTCSEQSSFLTCYGGSCCAISKYFCSSGDCGTLDIGCGQTLECGNTCEGTDTCQPNGTCCTPSNGCGTGICGFIDDGCGNYVDCGDPCVNDYACLGNKCEPSVCKENGFDCGFVDNPSLEGDEHCGMCSAGLGCLDNHCVPLCVLPPDTI